MQYGPRASRAEWYSRSMISASAWLAALAIILIGADAMAAPPAIGPETAIHLEVRAPPNCMTASDLAVRITARAPDIRVSDDIAAFNVRGDFALASSGQVTAELTIAAPGRAPSVRRVTSGSCSEAGDALALIIAVTLAPDAVAAARAAPNAEAKGPGADRPSSSSSSRDAVTPPTAVPAQRPQEKPVTSSSQSRAREGYPTQTVERDGRAGPLRGWRFGGGAALFGLLGPTPEIMPGIGVYGLATLDRDGIWSPAFRLGFVHGWRSGFVELGGTASYGLDLAVMNACALRIHSAALEARACASGSIGVLSSTGSETFQPASATRPFAALGVAVLASYHVSNAFSFSLLLSADATIVRDSYEFTSKAFYEAAPATLSGGIGFDLSGP